MIFVEVALMTNILYNFHVTNLKTLPILMVKVLKDLIYTFLDDKIKRMDRVREKNKGRL